MVAFPARLKRYDCLMDERTQPSPKPDHPEEEERDRRATNIFLAVIFLVIVGLGLWLVNAMVAQKTLDDCISQGRRNCGAPIDVPSR